jgi:hypothetical protein
MTIAACYLSPEGVVLGADSTSSMFVPSGTGTGLFHYFNHNQKLFEVGENSSLGMVTWGLGGLGALSHRALIANLDDSIRATPATPVRNVQDVATRWAGIFWSAYSAQLPVIAPDWAPLQAKPSFVAPHLPQVPGARTKDEEERFQALSRDLVVGFCIGGYVLPQRTTTAYTVLFQPSLIAQPTPIVMPMFQCQWFGVPNLILRLINGYDISIVQNVMNSGKWNGTEQDLRGILDKSQLAHPVLPIRDAIDFVYTSIYSTIKAMKFSTLSQVCGGPIELAVITSDRRFRWVRHKSWDSAIGEDKT